MSWSWTSQKLGLNSNTEVENFFFLVTEHFSRQKKNPRHLEWKISDMGREREKNAGNGKLESSDELEGPGERYI